MNPRVAKVLHQFNLIPGVRFRMQEEHVCLRADFHPHDDAAVQPRVITREELPSISAIRSITSFEGLAHRMDLGNECWLAEVGGAPAHSQWVFPNLTDWPVDLARTSGAPKGLQLPPHSIYFWDAWCAPAFRGRNLSRSTKSFVMRHYLARGIERVHVLVEPFNIPNLKSIGRLGFVFQRTLFELTRPRPV